MIEIFNLTAIYIGKKDYKRNFWDSEGFLKLMKPKYVKWQNAWKNRILNYTPRYKPAHKDVELNGIIENWDPKAKGKEANPPQTIKMSPLFGPDVVKLYKAANEAHPASTPVKSLDAAENLRALVGLDLKFMVGCDEVWEFSDDEDAGAGPAPAFAAAPAPPLAPAAAGDDAAAPPPPPVDPCDFTKWDVLDLQNAPLPAQQYDAANFRARRSAHAGLLLCFMSPIVETAFSEVAQTLEAGFHDCYGIPVTVEAVRRYPTVGRNAFTPEEESWFNSTYEYLESLLDDNGRERRSLPPKKRVRVARGGGGGAGGDGPAAGPGRRTARSSLSAADQPVVAPEASVVTEDDEDNTPIFRQKSGKKRRKSRYTVRCCNICII